MIAEFESRFIDAGDVRTHYLEAGEGPPVVLVHGGGAGADSWSNFHTTIPRLANEHRVIAVDMVGFGRTDTPDPAEFSYRQASRTEHLVAFLEALDVADVTLVGNSMGGTTACGVAMSRPDLVRGLLLMGAAVNMGPADIAANHENLSAVLGYDGTIEGQRRIIASLTHAFTPSDELLAYRHAAAADPALAAANKAAMRFVREEGLGFSDQQLGSLRVPVMVMAGRHDVMIPLHKQLEAARQIGHAWVTVFPHCGHWVMVEDPQTFADWTSYFARRLASGVT